MARQSAVIALTLLLGAACDDGRSSLVVDLRTDLVPGIEAARAQVDATVGDVSASDDASFFTTDELIEPRRVATLDLPNGVAAVRVTLFDQTGRAVLERPVQVRLAGDTAITVVMTRDCRGFSCPTPDGNPTAAACLGGRCVPEECVEGGEECGEPACASDAECAPPADDCASARCVEGTCLAVGDNDLCDALQYCDPDLGCLDRPRDGGLVDAGPPDSGLVDAGPPDAGHCTPTGDETCDGTDEDCDGVIDNGADLCPASSTGDPVACREGACVLSGCMSAMADCDGVVSNGCESAETDAACLVPVEMAVGGFHGCTRLRGGRVYCWGYNVAGEVGNDTIGEQPTPVRAEGITDAISLSLAYQHSCAIRRDASVWCWGWGARGQLGGDTGGSRVPRPVAGMTGALEVATGNATTCARFADGRVSCVGVNNLGQLGDGVATHEDCGGWDCTLTPLDVALSGPAVSISLGYDHGCAVLPSGEVECWGRGDRGQLGDGLSPAMSSTPVPVADLDNALSVFCGEEQSCARTAAGGLVCWGANLIGELGDGTTGEDRPSPVNSTAAGTGPFGSIGLGSDHGCAVAAATGTLRCWGQNGDGQLGDGTTMRRLDGVTVDLSSALSVGAGPFHSCAVAGGAVYCWGSAFRSALGVDPASDTPDPVMVDLGL